MTTYFVTVGRNEYIVEILNNWVLVNGQRFDYKLSELNKNGLYLLQEGTRKLEMLLRPQDRNNVAVSVENHHVLVQVEQGTANKSRASAAVGEGMIQAPMPGVVVQTCVEVGQMVSKGQVVLLLESMKMQMEIRSPLAGKVAKINVKDGIKVEKGAPLVQIEP